MWFGGESGRAVRIGGWPGRVGRPQATSFLAPPPRPPWGWGKKSGCSGEKFFSGVEVALFGEEGEPAAASGVARAPPSRGSQGGRCRAASDFAGRLAGACGVPAARAGALPGTPLCVCSASASPRPPRAVAGCLCPPALAAPGRFDLSRFPGGERVVSQRPRSQDGEIRWLWRSHPDGVGGAGRSILREKLGW